MRALPLVILIAACGGDPTPLPTGAMTVTVDHYDYTFDLESRAAHATVTMTVTGEGNCLALPLRAALVGRPTLDGIDADATTTDTTLTACGTGWNTGDTVTLDADLTVALATLGATQVGYSIATDAQNAPFYYLLSWVNGCDQFAPCDSAPDQFATYHFTVTHAADTTVLCPGTVTAGATSTECGFDFPGGPTYSTFGIVASPDWETTDEGMWGDLAVTFYNRVGSGVEPAVDDAWIGGYVTWMEQHFGAFPYGHELRVATGPTYWAGFEHPGNIVLVDTLNLHGPFDQTYTDPVAHTLAHEITHQWAGDQTTLADTYDFSWKESMAEYLAFAYEAETAPTAAAKTTQLWKLWGSSAAYYPFPTDHPALVDYYGDAYGAGPMVLFRQLESLFSRDQVIAAIAELLGQPRAISVDDVRAALEDTTGADLSGYFARWVKGAGAPTWPHFTIATADDGAGGVNVTVSQLAPEQGLYGCAFDVELDGATVDQKATARIDLGVDGNAVTTVNAQPGFAVVSTRLDPNNECLAFTATARTARHAPGWSPWIARSTH